MHRTFIELNVLTRAKKQKAFEAMNEFDSYLEKKKLLHAAPRIAFKRKKINKRFKIVYSIIPLIGLPTHHSKVVAFQTPATPVMEGILDLHHDIMFFLVYILIFVLYLLFMVAVKFPRDFSSNIHGYAGDNVNHSTFIEVI